VAIEVMDSVSEEAAAVLKELVPLLPEKSCGIFLTVLVDEGDSISADSAAVLTGVNVDQAFDLIEESTADWLKKMRGVLPHTKDDERGIRVFLYSFIALIAAGILAVGIAEGHFWPGVPVAWCVLAGFLSFSAFIRSKWAIKRWPFLGPKGDQIDH